MTEAIATTPSVYAELEMTQRAKLERCAKAIDKAKSKGVELIFAIGEQLQIAHDELANHGDGTFQTWCKERLGISHTTANNYLNALEAFNGRDRQPVCQSFDAKALYYLSRDTTPEEAIEDALKLAKSGGRVTLQVAKELTEEYTVDEEDDADIEQEADEEQNEDEDKSTAAWDIMQCELVLTREARHWWSLCPEHERKRLPELLRYIATNLEKRLHGNPS